MGKIINLVGKRFGRLIVVNMVKKGLEKDIKWVCKCDCGKIKEISGISLRESRTISCGCYKKEINTTALGQCYKTSEYGIWNGMKGRCYNNKNKDFKNYGQRGIKVCDRWLGIDGFKNFFNDMGERPSKNYSLNRIDNDSDYSPNNCEWATDFIQRRNRRDCRWIEFEGRKLIISDWAKLLDISVQSLTLYLKKYSFPAAYKRYIYKKYSNNSIKMNHFIMNIN